MNKVCSKCQEEKPATREFFYKSRNGLRRDCKACCADSSKKRNARPEVKAASKITRKRYLADPDVIDKLDKWGREYRRRPEVREKQSRYNKEYLQRPGILEKFREYNQKRLDAMSPEGKARYIKNFHLVSNYGITLEQYEERLEKQDNRCAICAVPAKEKHKYLDVDHCHGHCVGRKGCPECIRGIVCSSCNVRLARHEESLDLLLEERVYLQRYGNR